MSISVDKAVLARLTKAGKKFEVLVDPVAALAVRTGKELVIDDVLAAPEVFEDAHKGSRPSGEELGKTFGTTDVKLIATRIIKEGEVQLTAEQRKHMLDEKTKAVAALISRQGVDPRSGAPHPPDRVLRAIEQAKVRIDIEKRAEEQIDAVLKAIQPIIPIRFERATVAIKIPTEFAARASGIVRNFGTPSREEWGGDGSYMAVLEIPAGLQSELSDKMNSLTRGSATIKLVRRE
ncbi:MAG: ribosome assembly factor SBDS [Candidatus Aenigmatarchaeota archaeon]